MGKFGSGVSSASRDDGWSSPLRLNELTWPSRSCSDIGGFSDAPETKLGTTFALVDGEMLLAASERSSLVGVVPRRGDLGFAIRRDTGLMGYEKSKPRVAACCALVPLANRPVKVDDVSGPLEPKELLVEPVDR